MATSNSTNDTLPGQQQCRALSDETHRLGTDADGNTHYVLMARNVVWIVDADDVLGGIQRVHSLGAYVDHVAAVTGWDSVAYTDGDLADILCDVVRQASQQQEADQ